MACPPPLREVPVPMVNAAGPSGYPAPVMETSVKPLAFSTVYETYAAFIWQSLRRLGVGPADVEDVCQEVFTVVHRKLGTFHHGSTVRTWLYAIALRCASEYRRRAVRREIPTKDFEEQKVLGLQIETVERRQARSLLDAVLDTLDEEKRAVFVLYELDEIPMAEIATIVECPLQTAYSRLHAARRHVEREIERLQTKEAVR